MYIEEYKNIFQKVDSIIFVCSYNKKVSLKRILILNKLLSSHIDMSKIIQQFMSIKTIWNIVRKFLKIILKELVMKLIQIIIKLEYKTNYKFITFISWFLQNKIFT